MTQQRKQAPSAFATTVLAIPIVNFVGQFFVSSPSFEQVERTLSMLGLVSALVLAVAYSLPGTVSYDELRAADQRFGFSIDDDLSAPNSTTTSHMAAWYHDSAFGGSKPPSFNYGYFLAIACYTLTVALLAVVVQYIFLVMARGMAETSGRHDNEAEVMRIFNRGNRIVTLAVVAFVGMGCGTFYMSLFYLVVIKWPDYHVSQDAAGLQAYDPVALLVCMLPVAVGVCATVGGIGQVFIYRTVNATNRTSPQPHALKGQDMDGQGLGPGEGAAAADPGKPAAVRSPSAL